MGLERVRRSLQLDRLPSERASLAGALEFFEPIAGTPQSDHEAKRK